MDNKVTYSRYHVTVSKGAFETQYEVVAVSKADAERIIRNRVAMNKVVYGEPKYSVRYIGKAEWSESSRAEIERLP